MKIKTIEVETSFGGVISEAPYENIRPAYRDCVVIDIDDNDNEAEIRNKYRNELQNEQIREFDLLKNKMKTQLIEMQFKKIAFREKDGKKYPRVSSIISWMKEWKISENSLMQYAARGSIVHKLIEYYINNQVWLTLDELSQREPDSNNDIVLLGGNLKLSIDDCSYKEYFEKYGKEFEFDKTEEIVFNEDYFYTGRIDAEGKYNGKKSIIDFKTGSAREFKQLAAYAKCRDNIEQLVICPVGPTENKSGVINPVVSIDIEGEFRKFLKDRADFKKRFGI